MLQEIDFQTEKDTEKLTTTRIFDWVEELGSLATIQSTKNFHLQWSEFPQIPEGNDFVESLEIFLKSRHFSPEERLNTEKFALQICHYEDFEETLKICLKYSFNPLTSAIEVTTFVISVTFSSSTSARPTKCANLVSARKKRRRMTWQDSKLRTDQTGER